MKNQVIAFLLAIVGLFTGCEKDPTGIGGISIRFDDGFIVRSSNIDYYDMSAHILYLRRTRNFLEKYDAGSSFGVYADGQEIYTGVIRSPYSSYLHLDHAYIMEYPYIYLPDNCIDINYLSSKIGEDPRTDERIKAALQRTAQFREGIVCRIDKIEHYGGGRVSLTIELVNNDPVNYYFLDPDKMGSGLFHYYTNGLTLLNHEKLLVYSPENDTVKPEPWNNWKHEWLSLLESNQSRVMSFTYDYQEVLPSGFYTARFSFPGLGFNIERNQIKYDNGLIWLGEAQVSTSMNF